MGRGDKKTAKGKRSMGSHGNTRPKKSNTTSVAPAAPKKVKKATTTADTDKVVAKKVAAKKTVAKKAPAKKAVTKKKETEEK